MTPSRRNFAETTIREAYENAELAPPDPLPDALVERVLKGAAAAIEFEALIWEKLAFDGANPDKTRIRNLRPLDAGPLANSQAVETITALQLNLNRRYKTITSIQILGIP